MKDYSKFYRTDDPRDVPLYGATEAAQIIRGIPVSTLRSWFSGKTSVLHPAKARPVTLSFNDLIEASVLRVLRVTYKVQLESVRDAIDVAKRELKVERPLLHEHLYTDGAHLILKHYGEFVQLSRSKQLLMETLLNDQIQRIDWDSDSLAQRLYPEIAGYSGQKHVCVDPLLYFGQATVSDKKISTNVIYVRFNDGETVEDLQADYDLTEPEVTSAIVFEEAA